MSLASLDMETIFYAKAWGLESHDLIITLYGVVLFLSDPCTRQPS